MNGRKKGREGERKGEREGEREGGKEGGREGGINTIDICSQGLWTQYHVIHATHRDRAGNVQIRNR